MKYVSMEQGTDEFFGLQFLYGYHCLPQMSLLK